MYCREQNFFCLFLGFILVFNTEVAQAKSGGKTLFIPESDINKNGFVAMKQDGKKVYSEMNKVTIRRR